MTIIDLSYPRRFIQTTVREGDFYSLFPKILTSNIIITNLRMSSHCDNNIINMNFFYPNVLAAFDIMRSVNYYKLNAIKNRLTWKK